MLYTDKPTLKALKINRNRSEKLFVNALSGREKLVF